MNQVLYENEDGRKSIAIGPAVAGGISLTVAGIVATWLITVVQLPERVDEIEAWQTAHEEVMTERLESIHTLARDTHEQVLQMRAEQKGRRDSQADRDQR